MFLAFARLRRFAFHLHLLVISFIYLGVSANWQYKSRPDLSPPTLNITVPATSEVSPGLIFVAPYSDVSVQSPLNHGPLQPGPYIFTSSGELVWSGFGYISGFVTNFQTAKWKGEDILFAIEASRNTKHGHGHGHIKILNRNYETIKELRGGNSALLDIHEFHVVDERTALVDSYKPVPFNLKTYGVGPKSQWITEALFQDKYTLWILKS
jgi:Arylsulfotransferase (ASST)